MITRPPLSTHSAPLTLSSAAIAYTYYTLDIERRTHRLREMDPVTGKPLSVSQWAARYRYVTTGRMQGLWRNDVTPYAVEPMDCWSTPSIRKIFLMWPPQSSKTQIALNCIGYAADQDPGPLMYIPPDQELSRRVSKRRVQPMFERSPRLRELLSRRSEDNTLQMIRLKNGMDIMIPWASSAGEVSAEEARYLIFEEVDKYADAIGKEGKEGDPVLYGEMRQNTYQYTKKGLYISSPSAFPSRIKAIIATEADEIRRIHARCPFCGHAQIMTDDHLIPIRPVTDHRVIRREKLGRYACDKCGLAWDDYSRNRAVRNGYWKADASVLRPEAVAFLMAAWYSPEISLSDCLADKIRAERDEDPKHKLFYTTQRKGEEYSITVAAKTDEAVLAHRCSGYDGITPLPPYPPQVVPTEAIALTAGVDMQKYGFWFTVWAWAENYDSWLIDYGRLLSWDDLEKLIFATLYPITPEAGGLTGSNSFHVMPIWRAAIDTGGGKTDNVEITRTEEAYEWLRRMPSGRIYGIKGMSRPQTRRIKPTIIDKLPHSSKPIPGGLELRLIDSGQFKVIVHQRLDREPAEIGQHIFLHAETGADFARHITAEELRRKRTGQQYWHQVRAANHLLDCTAYAASCVDSEWVISFSIISRLLKEQQRQQAAGDTVPAQQPNKHEPPRRW